MRSVESMPSDLSMEIGRHSCRGATDLSPRPKFAKCAPLLWIKPAATIASIVGCDIRTAQRILAGQAEIPWCVIRAAVDEMLKPVG